MPSPVHQKYSSQSHKIFGDNTTPAMPEAPKQEADRRSSVSSVGSGSYPEGRRRSSTTTRFANLEALKRRQDEESLARRQSFHDAYGKPGFLGTLWNNFTRGPVMPTSTQSK
ncbi:hypothetical protein DDE82_008468 [Stemphylium lycopersici]|uniref:Conidiation-specific expression protein n=1 Tax=Stemphylium lycopersici TaxID=183478 RepID=A0A364MRU7_STELY|nr:hypothetical protein TW65_07727 [Stemphylium lycopersici]RAQ99228.1 hypothetical protein DDE82_008468 [Stemphylium lycopersici]RAR01242.1 hypothetical protein DDE83_008959 [Stemphylium lycopersici]